jgi:hypothetical protein
MHHEAPDTAHAEIKAVRGERKPVRAAPGSQMLWIGEALEDEIARPIEHAGY